MCDDAAFTIRQSLKVGVSESCVLGYNVNSGQEIHLRLRTAGWCRGLTLVHCSAQPEPLCHWNHPRTPQKVHKPPTPTAQTTQSTPRIVLP